MHSPREFLAKSSSQTSSVVVDAVVVVVTVDVDVVVVAVVVEVTVDVVVVVEVVLVVVCNTQIPLSSIKPESQTQSGAYDNKLAFEPQVQSSVDKGLSIAPKQRIQIPRLFLTIPSSHSAGCVVVDVVVVVVVVVVDEVVETVVDIVVLVATVVDVVVTGTHSPFSSLKPSSQKQIGAYCDIDAFSMQLQINPESGDSTKPRHVIHSPALFKTSEVPQTPGTVASHSPSISVNPSSHAQTGGFDPSCTDALVLQEHSSVVKTSGASPKQVIHSPSELKTCPSAQSPVGRTHFP
jgi:hypothetical protein